MGSHYQRVPFFGLAVLILAVIGAAQPFRSRARFHLMPNDVARSIAVGFGAFSALTLSPPWIVLNLPRMWMYRDGQTVFGLLCAAMALSWLHETRSRWLAPVLAGHLLQIGLVGGAIVVRLVLSDADPRLCGYARNDHTFFDALRRVSVYHYRLVLWQYYKINRSDFRKWCAR